MAMQAKTAIKIATFRARYSHKEFVHDMMRIAYPDCPSWTTLKRYGVIVKTGEVFDYEVDGVLVESHNVYRVTQG